MKKAAKLLALSLFLFFSCQEEMEVETHSDVNDIKGKTSLNSRTSTGFNLPKLHVEGKYIKDENGKVVILRGINTSGDSKVPPFMTLKKEHMDPLPKMGFNVLRLLFIWEAFEGTRDSYSEEYMTYFENAVKWAAEKNLYVIVDFHQDSFSRYAIDGCGEGFPEWAVPENMRKEPKNDVTCDSWGVKTFFNAEHNKLWTKFHNDDAEVLTSYVNMTAYVASRMSKHPNVIGYDVINEPWTGGIQSSSNEQLNSLYYKVGTAIREKHPESILFIPPHALGSSGLLLFNFHLSKPNLTNFVYAPHYYDPTVIVGKHWLGFKHYERLGRMSKRADDWGVPLLLGEFGGPAETVNIEGYTESLYNWLDNGLHHGTHWNYTPTWDPVKKDGWNNEDLSITDDKGSIRKNFKIRVTVRSIAGNPVSFKESKEEVSFSWENNPALGNTELFVPDNFAENYDFNTEDDVTYDIVENILYLSSESNGKVSISFTEKK